MVHDRLVRASVKRLRMRTLLSEIYLILELPSVSTFYWLVCVFLKAVHTGTTDTYYATRLAL